MDRPLLGTLREVPVYRRGLAIAHGGHHRGQSTVGDGPQALLQPLRDIDGIQVALPLGHNSALHFLRSYNIHLVVAVHIVTYQNGFWKMSEKKTALTRILVTGGGVW